MFHLFSFVCFLLTEWSSFYYWMLRSTNEYPDICRETNFYYKQIILMFQNQSVLSARLCYFKKKTEQQKLGPLFKNRNMLLELSPLIWSCLPSPLPWIRSFVSTHLCIPLLRWQSYRSLQLPFHMRDWPFLFSGLIYSAVPRNGGSATTMNNTEYVKQYGRKLSETSLISKRSLAFSFFLFSHDWIMLCCFTYLKFSAYC